MVRITQLDRINSLLLQDLDNKEAMRILKVTTGERIRQLRIELNNDFTRGKFKAIENISLSDDFLCKLKTISSNIPVYCSSGTLKEMLGCDNFESSFSRFFYNIKKVVYGDSSEYIRYDQPYYIPREQPITEVSKYINALTGVIGLDPGADVRPMSTDKIQEALIDSYPESDFDNNIVEEMLQQHKWIIQSTYDGQIFYSLIFEKLRDYQKVARLVYENKKVILNTLDTELINSINNAKIKYNWVVQGGQNGIYEYNPEGNNKKSIVDAINHFITEKVYFTYDEIHNYLLEYNFERIKEKTIRAYIMKVCQCSIDNSNLFCHSEYIDKYPNIRWRTKTQSGLYNWLLSTVIEYLKSSSKYKASKKEILKVLSKANPDNYELKNDLFAYLYKYIGIDGYFIIDKDTIVLTDNALILTKEELSSIGIRQKTPEYYKEAISYILSSLKKAKNGTMLLADIKKDCINSIPKLPESSFYKIVDKFLPDQVAKYDADGKLYLRIDETKVEYLPSYSIDGTKLDDPTLDQPILVKSEVDRIEPVIGARVSFTWESIKKSMCKEFTFYTRWWDIELDIEDSIDKFILFMSTAVSNNRLSKYIPQQMFEFWHFKNDEMDYYRYMIDITTCYEKLINDINRANTGNFKSEDGLKKTIDAFPSMRQWLAFEQGGFVNTYERLRTIRNKCAHGQDINNGMLSMIQNTTGFIALYVYTVARFWDNL